MSPEKEHGAPDVEEASKHHALKPTKLDHLCHAHDDHGDEDADEDSWYLEPFPSWSPPPPPSPPFASPGGQNIIVSKSGG